MEKTLKVFYGWSKDWLDEESPKRMHPVYRGYQACCEDFGSLEVDLARIPHSFDYSETEAVKPVRFYFGGNKAIGAELTTHVQFANALRAITACPFCGAKLEAVEIKA